MAAARVTATVVVVVFSALFGAPACSDRTQRARQQFVVNYVNSISDNTEFYRQFTRDADLRWLEEVRPRISKEFTVGDFEEMAPGVYEYAVQFSSGLRAIVTIRQEGDKVAEATFFAN
jgi:hypothetical protein